MIKLDVKDYCQNCPTFDADVVRPDKSYNADARSVIYVGDTTVRCCHREHCEWLKRELSENDRKDNKKMNLIKSAEWLKYFFGEFKDFDYEKYITINGQLRSDGVKFNKDTFRHCDGILVPIFLDKGLECMGYALLENRDDGVYAKCKFLDSIAGSMGKYLLADSANFTIGFTANRVDRLGHEIMTAMIRKIYIISVDTALSYVEG